MVEWLGSWRLSPLKEACQENDASPIQGKQPAGLCFPLREQSAVREFFAHVTPFGDRYQFPLRFLVRVKSPRDLTINVAAFCFLMQQGAGDPQDKAVHERRVHVESPSRHLPVFGGNLRQDHVPHDLFHLSKLPLKRSIPLRCQLGSDRVLLGLSGGNKNISQQSLIRLSSLSAFLTTGNGYPVNVLWDRVAKHAIRWDVVPSGAGSLSAIDAGFHSGF